MSFECPKPPSGDSPEDNAAKLEAYLNEAETDHDKQKKLARFAEERYGVKAMENKDGSASVLDPYRDEAMAVVKWFRQALEAAKIRMLPKDLWN